MDALLTIIAVLGFGALIISAFVFISAAKRYVTGEDLQDELQAVNADLPQYRPWVERSKTDRRQNTEPVLFPITVQGMYVAEDRRKLPDRRRAA